jgi:4a-hydroxytetrahydrobiopterin dehydratase
VHRRHIAKLAARRPSPGQKETLMLTPHPERELDHPRAPVHLVPQHHITPARLFLQLTTRGRQVVLTRVHPAARRAPVPPVRRRLVIPEEQHTIIRVKHDNPPSVPQRQIIDRRGIRRRGGDLVTVGLLHAPIVQQAERFTSPRVVVSGCCDDNSMDEQQPNKARKLTRPQASGAVSDLGWRYILGVLRTDVRTTSLAQAAEVAQRAIALAGTEADQSLRIDLRPDRAVLTLQDQATGWITARETSLSRQISEAIIDLDLATTPEVQAESQRSVQVIEIGIDALDIAKIRPFWKAVLGYADEADHSGPEDALIDPVGQGPSVWFQQMDAPRSQRNRIHFDVSVPHDEAQRRIQATQAAGGTLIYDAEAPAFWVLADPEGNEACVTTWQGRDG